MQAHSSCVGAEEKHMPMKARGTKVLSMTKRTKEKGHPRHDPSFFDSFSCFRAHAMTCWWQKIRFGAITHNFTMMLLVALACYALLTAGPTQAFSLTPKQTLSSWSNLKKQTHSAASGSNILTTQLPRCMARRGAGTVLRMSASTTTTVPSWSDLKKQTQSTVTGSALTSDVALREEGKGSPHRENKLRLFNDSSKPKITLYRDHAAWCPYWCVSPTLINKTSCHCYSHCRLFAITRSFSPAKRPCCL